MGQMDLFSSEHERPPKPQDDSPRRLRLLITVKAAPQPSTNYGETVCVAGISMDLEKPGWIRLYPINFRHLQDQDQAFKKYNEVEVEAVPARGDQRSESWRPRMHTLRVVQWLPPWAKRQRWVGPYVSESMCSIYRSAKKNPKSASLALVRARSVDGLDLKEHPGWTTEEQNKLDRYANQLDLLDDRDRTPLEPPILKGWYRWRCFEQDCPGHRLGILDWEFVALQRRLRDLPQRDMEEQLRARFLDQLCAPRTDTCFYVGNQAARTQVFSVLGVYYPPLRL